MRIPRSPHRSILQRIDSPVCSDENLSGGIDGDAAGVGNGRQDLDPAVRSSALQATVVKEEVRVLAGVQSDRPASLCDFGDDAVAIDFPD